jgi:eukaryotic-like serine/threonine-protein kinase
MPEDPDALVIEALARAGSSSDDLHAKAMLGRICGRLVGRPGEVRVGRFEIGRLVGRGGMGAVYEARDPRLGRKVAIKVIQAAPDERARVLVEARALARLQHPAVVQVYEADVDGDDVYIVMEYVEGVRLGAWLEESRPTVTEILRVLRAAGEGLASAHAAGVVHGDFKPDNVLVTPSGQAKIVDFGLARIAGGREGGRAPAPGPRSGYTIAGAGTPGYMAPEQRRGERVDARSDQYSFCVTLFEALVGHRPFAGVATIAERARRGLIDERFLGRLPSRLRAALAAEHAPAPARGDVPAWIDRAVSRGLAAQAEERWPSMDALLVALGRDPGRARRRALLIAAAAAAVALAAITATRAATRRPDAPCRGAERALAGVWDPDRKAAVHAAFLATGRPYAQQSWVTVERSLDAYAAGWAAMRQEACAAASVRHEQSAAVMDRRMLCLDARLRELRALSDLVAQADGAVVQGAADAAADLSSLAGCADVAALMAPVAPPRDAAARAQVAAARDLVARAKVLETMGRQPEGLALATVAVALARAIGYQPVEAEALLVLAAFQTADPKVREQTLLEALFAAMAGNDRQAEALAAAKLAYVVGASQARHARGLLWGRHARAARGSMDGDVAIGGESENAIGQIHASAGDYPQALAHDRRALALREQAFGPDHRAVAACRNNLGNVLSALGDDDGALDQYRRALAIDEASLGPEHPNLAITLYNIGEVYAAKGDDAQALAYYQRALAIWESVGPGHPAAAAALSAMGELAESKGDADQALAYHQRALAVRRAALGPAHPDVASSLNDIGDLYASQGDHDQALVYYRVRSMSGSAPSARRTRIWPSASATSAASTRPRATTSVRWPTTSAPSRSGSRPSDPSTPMWPSGRSTSAEPT